MKKSNTRRKANRATLLVSLAALVAVLIGGVVSASNMGFKLNFGVVRAVNRLLAGSGISIHVTVKDDNDPPRTLELNINPGQTQQSNMGFKLNIIAVPSDGFPVEAPNGHVYTVTADLNGFLVVQ